MRHFPANSTAAYLMRAPRTYTNDVTISFEGHHRCGSEIEVEVEFTCTPGHPATWEEPAYGNEVEIIDVRPFVRERLENGYGPKCYRVLPTWQKELFIECIDESKLVGED